MKISSAIRKAWRAYTASWGQNMKFLLVEACLTMICLCPLLFLTRGELAPAALLTVVLWIFLLIPARMNAAKAMRNALRGGNLCNGQLVETTEYGAKLICGLKRVGFLLLWSIPLIALAVEVRIHFSGEVDSFTVLRMIKNDLGGGDQMRGILVVIAMAMASLLMLMLGCAFHSGERHAWAQGEKTLVQGHHGKVLLTWLCSLLSMLPLLIALVVIVFRYLPVLSDLNGLIMKTVTLPSTRGTLVILVVGAILTLPLLPLRSLIPAAYVDGLRRNQ
ncbi:MAG: hypothetical protein IJ188_02215 [Clostridia bacterium]|nr:hypothetical protein [Clostridia bacterium]